MSPRVVQFPKEPPESHSPSDSSGGSSAGNGIPAGDALDIRRLTDEELIAQAQAVELGDRSRLLEELYFRHADRVLSWALRFSGDRTEALDLMQDCFLQAHAGFDGFEGRSSFSTWLYSILRRIVLKRRAQRSRVQLVELDAEPSIGRPIDVVDPVESFDPADRAVRTQQRRLLSVAIERLDPRERQVIRLRYGGGLSVSEVTEALGLDNDTGARAPLQSALRKLRRHFAARPSAERNARP